MPVSDTWHWVNTDAARRKGITPCKCKGGKRYPTSRHGRGEDQWRVIIPGQPVQSFPTKTQADDCDKEINGKLVKGEVPVNRAAGRMTFRAYVEEWLPKQNFAPSSLSHNKGYLDNHLYPYLGDMQLGQIASTAHSTLTGWLADMRKKPNPRSKTGRPYADSTIEVIYILLSTILKAAWKDKKIPLNPCDEIPFPKAGKPAKARAWEPTLVSTLLDSVPDAFEAMLLTAASCAHRPGEAAAVAEEDIPVVGIDIVHQVQRVRGELVLVPPKRNSVRTAPLSDATAQSLALHIQLYPTISVPCQCPRADHEGKLWRLLFHDQLPGYVPEGSRRQVRPQPLLAATFNEEVWYPALRAAGLDPASADRTGMHMLRHFAVSCWLGNGAQPHEVQEWVGHKSFTTTTDIYGHLFPSGTKRGRAIMDGVFGGRHLRAVADRG